MPNLLMSFDVETDGPVPGLNSMISIGAAAFDLDREGEHTPVSTFRRNVAGLPGASPDPETMRWWDSQSVEIKHANWRDPIRPQAAMESMAQWIEHLEGTVMPMAYPAGFDWPFLHWYMHRFLGHNPLGFECMDLKSYALGITGAPWRRRSDRELPKSWIRHIPYGAKHDPLDDAIYQGRLFFTVRGKRTEWIGRHERLKEAVDRRGTALRDLLRLKVHKDKHGKTDWYKTAQPDAWEQAKAALEIAGL